MLANPPVEKNPKTGARTRKNIILQTRISDKYNMFIKEVKTTNKNLHHTQPNGGVFNPSHTRVSLTLALSGADNDTTPIKRIVTHMCVLHFMTKNRKIFITDQQGRDERLVTCYVIVSVKCISNNLRLSTLVERDGENSMTTKYPSLNHWCVTVWGENKRAVKITQKKQRSSFPTFLEHRAMAQRKKTHSIERLSPTVSEHRALYLKIKIKKSVANGKIRETKRQKKSSRSKKNSLIGAQQENFVKSNSRQNSWLETESSSGENKIREITRKTKKSPKLVKIISISWNPTRNFREIKHTTKSRDGSQYVLHNSTPSLGIDLHLCSACNTNFKAKPHSLGSEELRTTCATVGSGGEQMFANPTTTCTAKPVRNRKGVLPLPPDPNSKQTITFWHQSTKYYYISNIINMEKTVVDMESPPAQENATRAAAKEAARTAGRQGCESCKPFEYCVCHIFIVNEQENLEDQGKQRGESGPSVPKLATSEPKKVSQATQPSGKERNLKVEGATPTRKCRKRPGETQRMAEERVEQLAAELVEEREEKEHLKTQLEEASRLLLEAKTNHIADNERQSELLQEQIRLLETSKNYHDLDICLWEDERKTLTGKIGDMTEELKNKEEEIGDLNWRIMGYEHTKWGAFCPVSLGLWAEDLLNKN